MHTNLKNTLILILGFTSFGCTKQQETVQQKPNIIFIISDDQAYGDYGFMGHASIETPNIDQLARESLTFTRGYASAPLCSPSLASIITGLYAYQHGITGNDPVVEYEGPKRPRRAEGVDTFPVNSYPVNRNIAYKKIANNFYKNKLLTQTLSENGYRSFQTGKWWVGSAEEAGFDAGMTHGDYLKGGRHGDEGLKIGRKGLQPIYDFIEDPDAAEQPFFVWYAPFLPHTPHTPPAELEEKYKKLTPNPTEAKYWAMIEWFDQTVGALQQYLTEKGLDENTIIVYTCDNGWIQDLEVQSYAPKSKRSPFEGGIRTPIMFKYPKGIQPKMDEENVVSNIDIVPTVHRLLDLDKGGLPGIDILDQTDVEQRKTVFAEAYHHDIRNLDDPTETLQYKIAVEKQWKLLLPNPEMILKA
ncbi:MAG: sulfatase-like hydrolase/transferase, partial [Bacteroidota bacterium]